MDFNISEINRMFLKLSIYLCTDSDDMKSEEAKAWISGLNKYLESLDFDQLSDYYENGFSYSNQPILPEEVWVLAVGYSLISRYGLSYSEYIEWANNQEDYKELLLELIGIKIDKKQLEAKRNIREYHDIINKLEELPVFIDESSLGHTFLGNQFNINSEVISTGKIYREFRSSARYAKKMLKESLIHRNNVEDNSMQVHRLLSDSIKMYWHRVKRNLRKIDINIEQVNIDINEISNFYSDKFVENLEDIYKAIYDELMNRAGIADDEYNERMQRTFYYAGSNIKNTIISMVEAKLFSGVNGLWAQAKAKNQFNKLKKWFEDQIEDLYYGENTKKQYIYILSVSIEEINDRIIKKIINIPIAEQAKCRDLFEKDNLLGVLEKLDKEEIKKVLVVLLRVFPFSEETYNLICGICEELIPNKMIKELSIEDILSYDIIYDNIYDEDQESEENDENVNQENTEGERKEECLSDIVLLSRDGFEFKNIIVENGNYEDTYKITIHNISLDINDDLKVTRKENNLQVVDYDSNIIIRYFTKKISKDKYESIINADEKNMVEIFNNVFDNVSISNCLIPCRKSYSNFYGFQFRGIMDEKYEVKILMISKENFLICLCIGYIEKDNYRIEISLDEIEMKLISHIKVSSKFPLSDYEKEEEYKRGMKMYRMAVNDPFHAEELYIQAAISFHMIPGYSIADTMLKDCMKNIHSKKDLFSEDKEKFDEIGDDENDTNKNDTNKNEQNSNVESKINSKDYCSCNTLGFSNLNKYDWDKAYLCFQKAINEKMELDIAYWGLYLSKLHLRNDDEFVQYISKSFLNRIEKIIDDRWKEEKHCKNEYRDIIDQKLNAVIMKPQYAIYLQYFNERNKDKFVHNIYYKVRTDYRNFSYSEQKVLWAKQNANHIIEGEISKFVLDGFIDEKIHWKNLVENKDVLSDKIREIENKILQNINDLKNEEYKKYLEKQIEIKNKKEKYVEEELSYIEKTLTNAFYMYDNTYKRVYQESSKSNLESMIKDFNSYVIEPYLRQLYTNKTEYDKLLNMYEKCKTEKEREKIAKDITMREYLIDRLTTHNFGDERNLYITSNLMKYHIGSIPYGKLDNNGTPVNFEWKILAENEDVVVLMMNKPLLLIQDLITYNEFGINNKRFDIYELWETSVIREFLNSYFYKNAFNNEEKEDILPVNYGNESDYVVILSEKEASTLVNSKLELLALGMSKVSKSANDYDYMHSNWLLRKTKEDGSFMVDVNGNIISELDDDYKYNEISIIPVICVKETTLPKIWMRQI